jgi:hypothetical protein
MYTAELTFALTFHSQTDLRRWLADLGQPPAGPQADAWAILSAFSEYADGHLHAAHLTGRGPGRLLPGHPQRPQALARQADGALTAVGEDGTRRRHILQRGQVTTRLDSHPPGPAADR